MTDRKPWADHYADRKGTIVATYSNTLETGNCSNVVDLDQHRATTDLLTCPCGGVWFDLGEPGKPGSVVMNRDYQVTGLSGLLTCQDCKKVLPLR